MLPVLQLVDQQRDQEPGSWAVLSGPLEVRQDGVGSQEPESIPFPAAGAAYRSSLIG